MPTLPKCSLSTGAKLNGLDDAFLLGTRELGATTSALSAMTDAERVAAAVSDPDLYWAGANVSSAANINPLGPPPAITTACSDIAAPSPPTGSADGSW